MPIDIHETFEEARSKLKSMCEEAPAKNSKEIAQIDLAHDIVSLVFDMAEIFLTDFRRIAVALEESHNGL